MKILRFGLLILLFFIVVLLGIFLVIFFNSSSKPKPFTDEFGKIINESISEKTFIEIGGKKIWFFIKGKNKKNPVLLYLHGGMPDYFLTQKYPTNLEDIFTVIWLEQRGSGMSYNAGYDDRDISLDDLIEDTKIVTEHLKLRFSQNNIYLMAHSGGTFLGIKVIEKYPELFKAYIGVAQITNQKLSEKLAYDYILCSYQNNEVKNKIVSVMLNNPILQASPIPEEYLKIRDSAMHDLGIGTMRNMKNIITGIFIPSLLFREYSFTDKVKLWRGKAGSGVSALWSEIIEQDLSVENNKFEIPVYIFHGIFDYTCSFDLSRAYFDKIDVPYKRFYIFENSAHSPIFEESEKCIKIIETEILNRN